MKLYHFTAAHLIDRIRKEGLTLGKLPLVKEGQLGYLENYQWLTLNPSFGQSWDGQLLLPYTRCAFRITVQIPKSCMDRLSPWLPIAEVMQEHLLPDFNSFGDPESWYLFRGKVKPKWFKKIEGRA